MAVILGIESTCDETAAAVVVVDGREVRSNVIATQNELHAKYRGVVPEIASRAHLENICPVITEAIDRAGVKLADIDGVAVAQRPGLIGSLLIGVSAAKALAWCLGKPLMAVDHVHAHLYSVMLDSKIEVPMPAVGLVCSGGHTALYRISSFLNVEMLGSTRDDAVGEAYDKVAAILELGYPGGPIVDELAARGKPDAIAFPRTLLDRESLDFSFSGLKTAVLYHVRGNKGREKSAGELSQTQVCDVAASFQAACIDVLMRKISRAAEYIGAKAVIVGGGVSANRGLRAALAKYRLPVFMPAMSYCTDNAAMIAGLGDLMLVNEQTSGLDMDAITFSRFAE